MGETHGSRFSREARRGGGGSGSGPGRRPLDPEDPRLRAFLPTCRAEMLARSWESVDIVLVTGDAYVDHPAFGPVLIARFLEARGYRVAILPQPDWKSAADFEQFGRPRLFFGVSAGNLDSMLNRLTSQKKNRAEDQYSPGGRTGLRPDRATMAYAQRCREAFKDVPVVLGGIEASLRRIAHYDYWSDTVRRSILMDSKADLLVFGMGERPIWEVARRLAAGEDIRSIRDVRGTAWPVRPGEIDEILARRSRYVTDGGVVELPAYETVKADKRQYAVMARDFQRETNPGNARPLLQRHGRQAVYYNPPAFPLSDGEGLEGGDGAGPARSPVSVTGDEAQGLTMDALYDLPFTRVPHPSYTDKIPAYETVKHSVVLMRGCFGGCTFCSITEHEGRIIQSRSSASVLREVRALRRMEGFNGTISDLGGPTANMYQMKCKSRQIESACRRLSCVHPGVCKNLVTDHGPVIEVMKRVRETKGVKHVFIASGVRYDLAELSPEYVDELAAHHVGGQLSTAPEHVSPRVLDQMKKPGIETYERFKAMFQQASQCAGKEQYDVPYFISGHPGCDLSDMVELALWLKREGYRPRQVQDFIPTPMSVAGAMYWTGLDPFTLEPIPVARGLRDKQLQKALLLYWDPKSWADAREALRQAGRTELIGHHEGALVPPAGTARERDATGVRGKARRATERARHGRGGRGRGPSRGGKRRR